MSSGTPTNITGPEVVANVETDALADKFTKHVYANGDMDVYGDRVHVSTFDGVFKIERMPMAHIPLASLKLHRAHALELRDALDVLLRATSKGVEG